jgi:hypothetical protein
MARVPASKQIRKRLERLHNGREIMRLVGASWRKWLPRLTRRKRSSRRFRRGGEPRLLRAERDGEECLDVITRPHWERRCLKSALFGAGVASVWRESMTGPNQLWVTLWQA